jgi:hypothetical protein
MLFQESLLRASCTATRDSCSRASDFLRKRSLRGLALVLATLVRSLLAFVLAVVLVEGRTLEMVVVGRLADLAP